MARYFKTTYEGLFPPFVPFIVTETVDPDNNTTTISKEPDMGEYNISGKRLIAPSDSGLVLAKNQIVAKDTEIKVTCTDGVEEVLSLVKVSPMPDIDWTIEQNVDTLNGNKGVVLTYKGADLGCNPADVKARVVFPKPDASGNSPFYCFEQTGADTWMLSPFLGKRLCFATIAGFQPRYDKFTFWTVVSYWWNKVYETTPGTNYKFELYNGITKETIVNIYLAYHGSTWNLASISTTWATLGE